MKKDNNNIYVCLNSNAPGTKFHKERKKPSLLRKLSEDKYHQSNWESFDYFSYIKKQIEKLNVNELICLDLGCGDGRFTEFLINLGVKKVVCVDSDYEALYELSQYSKLKKFSDKIEIYNSGVEDLSNIPNYNYDLCLAIGILYYLGENYENGICEIYKKIKNNAILISSEPNIEAIALRSLVFDGLEEMLMNFLENSMKEDNETNIRFPLLYKNEIKKMYLRSGFVFIDEGFITLFHQFLRIQLVKNNLSKESLEKNMNSLNDVFKKLSNDSNIIKTYLFTHKQI